MELNECIKRAMKEESHKQFAEFLMEKNPWKETNFAELFKKAIRNHMNDIGKDSSKDYEIISFLEGFKVIPPQDWNLYDNSINTIKCGYKKQTIRKWIKGDLAPQREIIIQYCLWMGVPMEQCNEILRSAGYYALYYLNPFDITAILFLRQNRNRKQLSPDEFEQIQKTHHEVISSVFDTLSDQSNNHKVIPEYEQKIHIHTGNIISTFKKMNSPELVSSQVFMTRYLEKEVDSQQLTLHNLKTFVSENREMFGDIHFGIIERLNSYVNTTDHYLKNIYNYRGTFMPENEGRILEIPFDYNRKKQELLIGGEYQLQRGSMTAKDNIITSLMAATYQDIMDKGYEGYKDIRAGCYADIRIVLDGRQFKNPEKKKYYLYYHPPKSVLIRMLIILGREDEIGSMLVRAGYWEKDWIDEYYDDIPVKLDFSDYLVIYLIRYRDELLKQWAIRTDKKIITYSNQNRSRFPFHKMTLEISHELYENLKNRYPENRIKLKNYLLMYNSNKSRGDKE